MKLEHQLKFQHKSSKSELLEFHPFCRFVIRVTLMQYIRQVVRRSTSFRMTPQVDEFFEPETATCQYIVSDPGIKSLFGLKIRYQASRHH